MKLIHITMLLLLITVPGLALEVEGFTPDESIVYKKIDSSELKIHVFMPQDHVPSDRRPAIVFFFGGGWNGGSPSQFYPHCDYFASRGMVAMSAEYRVKTRHGTSPRECVKDGKSVIRWIRVHADELGIDPGKLAAGGGSAGGHVAAATATLSAFDEEGEDQSVSSIPNALVLFNPVFDNGPEGYGYDRVKEYWEDISPMNNISQSTPPTIVFLGTKDKLIPTTTAEEYKKLMANKGRRCDLRFYKDQGHGFFNYRNKKYFIETVIEADKFLRSLGYVKGGPTLQDRSDLDADERHRVIISTDIGGSDPDDFQSMVHYLVYADVFETEGLISSPPYGGRARDILECIAAYETDYVNLHTWSPNYPSPDALRRLTRQGAIDPQSGDLPATKISEGAQLIIERAKVKDPRPLYVLVWGSITDVAQAVHNDPEIKSKLRIHSIGSWNTQQDPKARDYLFNNHRDLWWIESDSTFRGMYMGGAQGDELGNRSFTEKNVKGHGHLGSLFMRKKADIKMGDTPSVLYLLYGDPDKPEAAHWGGAFVRSDPDTRPTYWHDNPAESLSFKGKNGANTVSRWRKEYLLDWKGRMDRLLTEKPAME
ncbi:nucleoside hydrolase-like domain-containing protein [Planctomycetota bacterium]